MNKQEVAIKIWYPDYWTSYLITMDVLVFEQYILKGTILESNEHTRET